MPFRPYTDAELTNAAQAYGLDPAFVKAVYAVESSNGTDPNAMRARTVKRKRDSTIVRGPFQLEDDTTYDLIRNNKLGNVNVDDPDTHLELAMRLMSDLKDRYNGDYRKMAQAYLGGPGGVTNSSAKDELGTSTGTYGNKIIAEMNRIGMEEPSVPTIPGLDLYSPPVRQPASEPQPHPLDVLTPFMNTASADEGDDLYGVPEGLLFGGVASAQDTTPVGLGFLPEMGQLPDLQRAGDADASSYLARLVNEEFDNRDFTSAVA